jgi:hypothetical protein
MSRSITRISFTKEIESILAKTFVFKFMKVVFVEVALSPVSLQAR